MSEMLLPQAPWLQPTDDQQSAEVWAPYWQGLAAGELTAQCCDNCDRFRLPPLPACPICGSFEARWQPLTSNPTLFSWVVVRRQTHPGLAVPYCIAVAEYLPERVRVIGNIENVAGLVAGSALDVLIRPLNGVHVPVFTARKG